MTSIIREEHKNYSTYVVSVVAFGTPISRELKSKDYVQDAIADFQKQFPGITVKIVETNVFYHYPD